MPIALTRAVSPALARCELTHLDRVAIDWRVAEDQHREYQAALSGLGFEVLVLAAEPDYPDAVFVEDAALVFPELAVLTRPGAESRRGEVASIARALRPYRQLAEISEPAILDGGDVLVVDKNIHVGLSARSNQAGVAQLQSLLDDFGYRVRGVELADCLHLKSGITQVAEDCLLYNPAWVDGRPFHGLELIEVDASEPHAGNAVWIPQRFRPEDPVPTVIYPSEFPRTRAILEARGIRVVTVPAAELAKAEGGVTCCSLLFDD